MESFRFIFIVVFIIAAIGVSSDLHDLRRSLDHIAYEIEKMRYQK